MLKVTRSMMTTITTFLNRDFENEWSTFRFSTVQVALYFFTVSFGLRGVAASSLIGLDNRVLISVVAPFFRSSYVILLLQRCFDKFFQIGLCVSLFMHALLGIAHHCGRAPRSFRNGACARNLSNLLLF